MKKKIFFSLMLLLALSFFLWECGQQQDQDKENAGTRKDKLVNHTLLSDLALRAVLKSTDAKMCELASRLNDIAHEETNVMIRTDPRAEGICCCPCDPTDTTAYSASSARIKATVMASVLPENVSLQGNDCPCPTIYAWAIEARKKYQASVSIDDLPLESTDHGDWQTFTLGNKAKLEPGPYTITITANFLNESEARTYTLPIAVGEDGKPYLNTSKTP